MAAIGAGNPTLLDQIKRTDPNGNIAMIVEALQERNPILMDAAAMEGNLTTGHRVTVRSGLPTVIYRNFNQGVAASKSTTIQVDESVAMLSGRSNIDTSLARLNGNEAAFRASEEMSFLQALNITVANALFYSDVGATPNQFHGFSPRFNDLTLDNIVNYATVSGDTAAGAEQSSIWFITWSPETCFLIYPKGSKAGIVQTDLGMQLIDDGLGSNDTFLAWTTDWEWQIGLVVKDWRYVVRICNIDSGETPETPTNAAAIENSMIEAINRVYDLSLGRTVIYMNRQVLTWLERQSAAKATMNFTQTEWHQRKITGFRGLPIITLDALDTTEAPVT